MRCAVIIAMMTVVIGCAVAGDIVTMPTANQLKGGEVDLAAYYLDLDFPAGAPRFVNYQTAYVGLTDWLEVDVHHADVDRDKNSTVVVASVKLLSETATLPDLVVGVRNIFETETTLNPALRDLSKERSIYVAAAKTIMLGKEPGPPLARLHLGVGNEDWTLLGEKRHDGVFGGVQMLFTPSFGAVVEHDGTDLITGLTFMPAGTGLTLKAGTFGDHRWIGVSYLKKFF